VKIARRWACFALALGVPGCADPDIDDADPHVAIEVSGSLNRYLDHVEGTIVIALEANRATPVVLADLQVGDRYGNEPIELSGLEEFPDELEAGERRVVELGVRFSIDPFEAEGSLDPGECLDADGGHVAVSVTVLDAPGRSGNVGDTDATTVSGGLVVVDASAPLPLAVTERFAPRDDALLAADTRRDRELLEVRAGEAVRLRPDGSRSPVVAIPVAPRSVARGGGLDVVAGLGLADTGATCGALDGPSLVDVPVVAGLRDGALAWCAPTGSSEYAALVVDEGGRTALVASEPSTPRMQVETLDADGRARASYDIPLTPTAGTARAGRLFLIVTDEMFSSSLLVVELDGTSTTEVSLEAPPSSFVEDGRAELLVVLQSGASVRIDPVTLDVAPAGEGPPSGIVGLPTPLGDGYWLDVHNDLAASVTLFDGGAVVARRFVDCGGGYVVGVRGAPGWIDTSRGSLALRGEVVGPERTVVALVVP
jgi:hypothetical protein